MNNNNNNNENGMNRTRTNNDTSSMPDMVSGEEQRAPGCNFSKLRWTKEINKIVMVCYIMVCDPSKRGYRKRMSAIWREIGVFQVTEQRLADQARAIRINAWLTDVEIEKLRRKIERENTREENVESNEEGSQSNTLERELTSPTGQSDEEVNANIDRQREEGNQLDQYVRE